MADPVVPDDYGEDWTPEEWAEVLDDPLTMQLLRISGLVSEIRHNLPRARRGEGNDPDG